MKKKKLNTKLSLGKNQVSNLGSITGGYVTAPAICGTGNCGTGNCGGGTYTNNCSGQTCGYCITNNHPVSDPIHCRTCHDAC